MGTFAAVGYSLRLGAIRDRLLERAIRVLIGIGIAVPCTAAAPQQPEVAKQIFHWWSTKKKSGKGPVLAGKAAFHFFSGGLAAKCSAQHHAICQIVASRLLEQDTIVSRKPFEPG